MKFFYKHKNYFKWAAIALCSIGIMFILVTYITYSPRDITFLNTSSKVYDKNGNLLYEISRNNASKNTPVSIDQISPDCVNAIIATEDKTFRSNIGIDLNGTLRLALTTISLGRYRAGGSSITQQVVKTSEENIYDRGPIDKITEIIKAIKLNQEYSKNEILEMYINNIYFGNLNYGIESASQNYFGKPSADLSLAQCSYLAGVPQSPAILDPYINIEAGKRRQQIVLNAMVDNGYISQESAEAAFQENLNVIPDISTIKAPHLIQFMQDSIGIKKSASVQNSHVLNDTLERIDWSKSYKIYTYYDYDLHRFIQNKSQEIVDKNKDTNLNNVAVIVIGKNNELLTLQGSIDFFDDAIDGKFNSALGLRQPGTALTPIIYYSALGDFESNTKVDNGQFTISVKTGQNVEPETVNVSNLNNNNSTFVDFSEAINQNLTSPAVRIIQQLGNETIYQGFSALDMNQQSQENWCNEIMNLEGCEFSLLDLTNAYNYIRNGGKTQIYTIKEVRDLNDNLVYVNTFSKPEASDKLARFNSFFPENSEWKIFNGFTRNNKDIWTFAFNENYTIGIWMGNTEGKEMDGVTYQNTSELLFNDISEYLE